MNPKQQSFLERLKALLEAYDAKITAHARMEVENGVTTIITYLSIDMICGGQKLKLPLEEIKP